MHGIGTRDGREGPVVIHVAPRGDDRNPGTGDHPLRTLKAARGAVRTLKNEGRAGAGITVRLMEGLYPLGEPLELGDHDGGAPGAPVVYEGSGEGEARLLGGMVLEGFFPAGQAPGAELLPRKARGKVLCCDLNEQGIGDLGAGDKPPLVCRPYFNRRPLPCTRWPREGFARIAGLAGREPFDVRGTAGDRCGVFHYDGDRPDTWEREEDIWLFGYWFHDWAHGYQQVEAIDSQTKLIATVPPYHSYGYRTGQRYYAFNLLAELKEPGQWCLDRERGLLYLWPPADRENAEVYMPLLAGPLVRIRGGSHIVLRGLTLEGGRGTGIAIDGGEKVLISGCTLRNLGATAITVDGGLGHRVQGSHLSQLEAGGISLFGGNRSSLEPAGHTAADNHIHDFSRRERTYTPAIRIGGVGNRALHNLIHDAPHMAIGLAGNDHLLSHNEVHSVARETSDVGAVYTGRNWTYRGQRICCNYFHDMPGIGEGVGAIGVYLDDMMSSATVEKNIFHHVDRGLLIGGGRDNVVRNNLILDCNTALTLDDRALGWAHYHAEAGGTNYETLKEVPYREEPWSSRYPRLARILDDEPAVPKGNRVEGNLIVNSGDLKIADTAREHGTIEGNVQLDVKVDAEPGSFLDGGTEIERPEGWEPIPLGEIGPRRV